MPDRPASGTALRIQGLSKRFGDEAAVADVSLDVRAGEFLTLLGPSGSGKTTTLNMVAGFIRPDAGEIVMDGRNIAGLPPHRRNIGMVFQHYALFPHMSAFDNVAFALRERKVPRRQAREQVERVLELVRLSDFAGRFPSQLSGGEQQRVALARAMVFNPGLLLMDEPLGALDRKLREWLQFEIKRIHREVGITFVYVTHDQEEALVLSDRIAIFNRGRIEQIGTPDELYERPRTMFVAEFVGESNLFVGPVVDERGNRWIACGEDRVPLPREAATSTAEQQAILIRPERLAVEQLNGRHVDAGTTHGRIRQIVYLGSTRRIEVELPSGRTLIAREVAARHCQLSEGDHVRVTWSPQDSVVVEGSVQGDEGLGVPSP